MANLQFNSALSSVVDTVEPSLIPDTPPVEIASVVSAYRRDVDTRTVIFESGIEITFSNHMSATFEHFLTVFEGPRWLMEAWAVTQDIVVQQKASYVEQKNIASFLCGRADHLALYQQFSS